MKKTKLFFRDIGLALLIILCFYLIIVYLILPVYTRHWQSISVPNVTGLSQRAAEKILKNNNLQPLQDIEKFDDRLPPGFIVFQNPEPGRNVKKKRRIYLTVSKGYRNIKMPDLTGLPIRDARFTLDSKQLEIDRIEYNFHHFYPENVIIDQNIAPDTEIPVQTQINLLVSLGEKPVMINVPDLIGNNREQAVFKVKKSGLTLGDITVRESNVFPDETVIYQSINAGATVSEGDTLNITLTDNPSEGEHISW